MYIKQNKNNMIKMLRLRMRKKNKIVTLNLKSLNSITANLKIISLFFDIFKNVLTGKKFKMINLCQGHFQEWTKKSMKF